MSAEDADDDTATDSDKDGQPLPNGYLVGTGSRLTYLRGSAMRSRPAGLSGTTRFQMQACLYGWCGGSFGGNSSVAGSDLHTICMVADQVFHLCKIEAVATTIRHARDDTGNSNSGCADSPRWRGESLTATVAIAGVVVSCQRAMHTCECVGNYVMWLCRWQEQPVTCRL